jgi:hypothetical protein
MHTEHTVIPVHAMVVVCIYSLFYLVRMYVTFVEDQNQKLLYHVLR